MGVLAELYKPSLALLTDLYELTMACGYWKTGIHDRQAVFHLIFRENPFQGGFTVACGLQTAVEFLEQLRFEEGDIAYLAGLRGADGKRIFDSAFLDYLHQMQFACDVDAVSEGTVVFPQEPLVRVVGPLVQSQIVETALLNIINFQTLIATKAARVVMAARGEPVLEFGLRRAQGIDGGLSASRAAYVAGCAGTSNVLAGRLYGIPVKGTHAHSWVMCFDDEPAAFRAYAQAMPNNCVFLVDTYDTLEGVRNAVEVGRWLRENGYEMLGIRLDSGDLASLSIEAREILDQAGFRQAAIIASNDLDEHIISRLKEQGATIGVWGVGTRLVTGQASGALGGVYKLTAIRGEDGLWQDKVKVSEQTVKTTTPGILQVRRYQQHGQAIGDVIFDQQSPIRGDCVAVDLTEVTRQKAFPASGGPRYVRTPYPATAQYNDLLVPVFRRGKRVYDVPSIENARRRAQQQLAMFGVGVKRFVDPDQYPVGLELTLHQRKTEIISSRARV